MNRSEVAQALAEGFWNGWVPTDLSQDYLEALEMSAMGPPAYQELRGLIAAWDLRSLPTEALLAHVAELGDEFLAAAERADLVERPFDLTTGYLLHALQEALRAIHLACEAVIHSVQVLHREALFEALESAEMAAGVLQDIYDGTHFDED